MTSAILEKGLCATVFHPDDSDGVTLTDHLRRVGFQVQAFWPPVSELPPRTDLVFQALLPQEREPNGPKRSACAPPLILIIPYENPTFIDQSWKMGASAVITTPIRVAGLLSTIIFAFQNSRQARQQALRIARLEEKVRGSYQLTEAKNILTRLHNVSETDAYELLRSEAMSKRITVEEVCQSLIQANEMLSRLKK